MKILLAIDGSSPSQDAIDEVSRRPWPEPSTVRVISVVRPYVPPATEFAPSAVTPEEVMQQHEFEAKQLAAAAAARVERPGVLVDTAVRRGDPRTEIIDAAEEWGADLIIVGSHGRTGLRRLLLGSVALAVVSHARCSVEVVRRPHWKE